MVIQNGSGLYMFAFDDPSRWNEKSEKCKESIHQKLTNKKWDEKDGRDQLYFYSYGQSMVKT